MGYKNTKKYGEKIYSHRQTFRAKVHKSNIRVKRWHSNYRIYSINRRGRLLNFWTLRVGAYYIFHQFKQVQYVYFATK